MPGETSLPRVMTSLSTIVTSCFGLCLLILVDGFGRSHSHRDGVYNCLVRQQVLFPRGSALSMDISSNAPHTSVLCNGSRGAGFLLGSAPLQWELTVWWLSLMG